VTAARVTPARPFAFLSEEQAQSVWWPAAGRVCRTSGVRCPAPAAGPGGFAGRTGQCEGTRAPPAPRRLGLPDGLGKRRRRLRANGDSATSAEADFKPSVAVVSQEALIFGVRRSGLWSLAKLQSLFGKQEESPSPSLHVIIMFQLLNQSSSQLL